MLTETDIRIGNYIQGNGVVVTVDALDIYGNLMTADSSYDDGYRTINNPEGIPLNAKWLNKFQLKGIEQNNGTFNFFQNLEQSGVRFWVEQNDPGVFTVCYGGFVRGVKIEYVHQLQNLYFALVGKDIEIKK